MEGSTRRGASRLTQRVAGPVVWRTAGHGTLGFGAAWLSALLLSRWVSHAANSLPRVNLY